MCFCNYLTAMQDSDRKFLLNGEFVVRSDRWMFKVKGGLMEYSGSDCQIERINSSYLLGEPINLYVSGVTMACQHVSFGTSSVFSMTHL